MRPPRTEEDITRTLFAKDRTRVSKSNEGDFLLGTVFHSYHYWAAKPLSDRALLAGFLMLWLKRCVVPSSPPHEAITREGVYPAVLLAFYSRMALLPAMIAHIQAGLRQWRDS